MHDFESIRNEANELRKQQKFLDSLPLYKKIWTEYRNECSCWDGWGYATCLRKIGQPKKAIEICREIYKIDSAFEIGNNLYAWCIYDLEIRKGIDEIKLNEGIFFKAASSILKLVKQDNFSPYVRTIFQTVSYLSSKQNMPYGETIDWLRKIIPSELSNESKSFTDNKGKEREFIPDKERWYSLMTKALFKSGKHKECADLCKEALSVILKFHFDNDVWIKRRLALSQRMLGDQTSAIENLKDVLKIKNAWFIEHELATLYFDQGKDEESYKFAIDSALNSGKIENKWKLYFLIGKILARQGQNEYAEKHFIIVNNILHKQGWKQPDELVEFLKDVNVKDNQNQKELFITIREFWEKDKYGDSKQYEGKITKIMHHGNAGFIKTKDGNDYYFRANQFKENKRLMTVGQYVSFNVKESFDRKKMKESLEAINIRIKK